MRNKFKKLLKNRIFIFVLGGLIFGTVGVCAATYFPSNQVTYDNKTSGLESTDVQGAIDELYNACFPPTIIGGDGLLENVDVVTSGDGLYADKYESGRYIYKGKNVNNYVTFNNEKAGWRIISIENDGTIKIIRNSSIGNMTWDSSNNNSWARPASLNTYLNNSYYNILNSTSRSLIVDKYFNAGKVDFAETNLQNTINEENSSKWYGKIGLITASEYARSNTNESQCGNLNKLVYQGQDCGKTTWLVDDTFWWTITSLSDNSFLVMSISSSGGMIVNNQANTSNEVKPVFYLSTDAKITGGNGTQSNPYVISE